MDETVRWESLDGSVGTTIDGGQEERTRQLETRYADNTVRQDTWTRQWDKLRGQDSWTRYVVKTVGQFTGTR